MPQFSENTVNAGVQNARIAVVIPCFRCQDSISAVISAIPEYVAEIICVDDCSDDDTARVLRRLSEADHRVSLVMHDENQGVGGATLTGYKLALKRDADVIVKLDSDGQMDPAMIAPLVAPLIEGEADYTKGNRFFDIEAVRAMPAVRLAGNAALSFVTKMSTGYWDLFDPTNGFTAIHADVARAMPLERLHKRYFFESDMLFRLSTIRARIIEIPMQAIYGSERSNLSIRKTMWTFPGLHLRNCFKRIAYNYFLRGFSVGSLSLIAGVCLAGFGIAFGLNAWIESSSTGVAATSGTVMVSALPLILGVQLLLHFLNQDIASVPQIPVQKRVHRFKTLKPSESKVDSDQNKTSAHKLVS